MNTQYLIISLILANMGEAPNYTALDLKVRLPPNISGGKG